MRILLLLAIMPAAFAQNRALPPALPPTGDFAGSNVCKMCHVDIWSNFYKNPHYKSVASGTLPPDKTGCEGCHGPVLGRAEGPARVEAHDPASRIGTPDPP